MNNEKIQLINQLSDYLVRIDVGHFCGKWNYLGTTDRRFSTPGGPWKKRAYRFKKDDREMVFSTEYETGKFLYVVIESINRQRQTANYDFDRYTEISSNSIIANDNFVMTFGTWGRLKNSALEGLYKDVGLSVPHTITEQSISEPNFDEMIEDFLLWGEKRDECKEIIEEDPEGFFGYTKDIQPEVEVRNKWNIAPPDEAKKNEIEKNAVELATQYLKNVENFNNVLSREHERGIGYDLLASENHDDSREDWHVEVKGTSASKGRFFLSKNEHTVGKKDQHWRLILVTNALEKRPKLKLYDWQSLVTEFDIEPLSWYGLAKK